MLAQVASEYTGLLDIEGSGRSNGGLFVHAYYNTLRPIEHGGKIALPAVATNTSRYRQGHLSWDRWWAMVKEADHPHFPWLVEQAQPAMPSRPKRGLPSASVVSSLFPSLVCVA
ncbi:MAG: hypothetical protein AVDCRST_MAG93-7796 [uncultured Chloroflexia bacterium]|uniref:Uncharacterized protein n=1 Tax=uncultured Chloroflexia bacterium TaxID=1672391 RepID=A0A6J4MP63_9CHLR|nr:MAG: hypothetical protein AVDCRST_MAG93-7796 [uncultured Chloroflexia bacterium]